MVQRCQKWQNNHNALCRCRLQFFPLNTWSAEWISSLNRDVLTIKRKNNSMALQCGSSKSSMTNLTHLTQEQPQPQHRWVGSVDHHWVLTSEWWWCSVQTAGDKRALRLRRSSDPASLDCLSGQVGSNAPRRHYAMFRIMRTGSLTGDEWPAERKKKTEGHENPSGEKKKMSQVKPDYPAHLSPCH